MFVAVVLMMVSGCDFFRKVAGRPTSEDIQAKKAEIAKVEEEKLIKVREQARLDSLAEVARLAALAEEKAVADSLAARAVLEQNKCVMYDLNSLKGLASGELFHRYYIVVGSFRDSSNADKFMTDVAKDSLMAPVKMRFRTGMVAVGVCPRNKLTEIAEVIGYVKEQKFCPKDAWVLVNQE